MGRAGLEINSRKPLQHIVNTDTYDDPPETSISSRVQDRVHNEEVSLGLQWSAPVFCTSCYESTSHIFFLS
jgi:hypothetical protein